MITPLKQSKPRLTTSLLTRLPASPGPRKIASTTVRTRSPRGNDVAARALREVERNNGTYEEKLAVIAAGIVESNLRHMKGGDRDSSGFLQQRPSMGWGSANDSIEKDTRDFLKAYRKVKGIKDIGDKVQATQKSAYPDKYGKVLNQAKRIVRRKSGGSETTVETEGSTTVTDDSNVAVAKMLLARSGTLGGSKPGSLLQTVMQAKAAQPSKTVQTPTPAKERRNVRSDPWKAALLSGGTVSSGVRPGAITSSGNVSDHTGKPGSGTMARDFVGKDLEKIARAIARSLRIKNYKPGSIVNVDRNGYRYQLIYGTDDHLDHVHLGRKPL